MAAKERLSVSLLGGFKISRSREYFLTEQENSSRRLLAFLEYLAVFHQRLVSQDELIDALWGDMDSCNPSNTLKTLLHRARNAMEEQLGFSAGKDVILYKRGMYSWHPDIELDLDIERFDIACSMPVENDLVQALDTIKMYSGDFIPNSAGSPWTVSLRTYYHTKYLKRCTDTAAHLIKLGRYEHASQICREALVIDPYEESCHMLLMQAMVADGARQAAIQHYTYVNNMLMDQLGVTPSDEMTKFYRELTKAEMGVEMDLRIVRERLMEDTYEQGAFFCEYVMFQNIYRLRARDSRRNGQVVQLAMLTVLGQDGGRLNLRRCATALAELHNAIHRCLRAGDTFTRFSASQYLILLPTASYEDGMKILYRVYHTYQSTRIGMTTTVKYSLLPMLPAEEELSPAGFVPVVG